MQDRKSETPSTRLAFELLRNYIGIMKAKLIQIGNSRGIRLPKPVIDQCGFSDEVELEVRDGDLVIRSGSRPRDGWAAAFARMGPRGDDQLLDRVAEPMSAWDAEEWEW
jgi:antitoxin MazE